MNGKHNHSRLCFIKHIGVFEIGISCMYVAQAVDDFYFWRKNKMEKVKVETNTCLSAILPSRHNLKIQQPWC